MIRELVGVAAAAMVGAAIGAGLIWYGLIWIFRGGR